VVSIDHAHAIVKYAADTPEKLVQTTMKIDTGLHRSGVDESQWEAVFTLLRDAGAATGNIEVTGVMSHLACADEPDNPANDVQAAAFNRAIALGRQLGLELPVNHLSNSPAVLTRPDFYHDMVRPGLAIYGYSPLADGNDYGLQPAMSWVGKVTVVKPIEPGEGTSYNLTWRASESGYLAVIPAGYADGLPRRAQNHVEVTIGGHRYPQVGRICMDQFVIDLGDNPHNVRPGDEAIIFGPSGMSATELASRIQDINYAVICAPTGRTVRRYIGGQHA
jgi:alanine racemase